MTGLKEEYTKFLADLEKNIKNEEDLNYIKQRFASFVDVIIDQMEKIIAYKEVKMQQWEDTQKELQDKLGKMENIINNIEKDIYAEDGFDFEIVCPYCNYQFLIDVDENKTEMECPECHNVIELDWTGDVSDDTTEFEGCSGSCQTCSGCDIDNDYSEEENEGEEKNKNQKNQENDDDM